MKHSSYGSRSNLGNNFAVRYDVVVYILCIKFPMLTLSYSLKIGGNLNSIVKGVACVLLLNMNCPALFGGASYSMHIKPVFHLVSDKAVIVS